MSLAHMLHVWNIYLYFPEFWWNVGEIFYTWSISVKRLKQLTRLQDSRLCRNPCSNTMQKQQTNPFGFYDMTPTQKKGVGPWSKDPLLYHPFWSSEGTL